MLVFFRYLLFMKMAALQLMQQKANKENKVAALPETSSPALKAPPAPLLTDNPESSTDSSETSTETLTESNADAAAAPPTEAAPKAAQPDGAHTTPTQEAATPTTTTNGPSEPVATATQNGECESPLEGKEPEDSIPGLAQAKELAESLVAEDGSGIGTLPNTPGSKHGEGKEEPGRAW